MHDVDSKLGQCGCGWPSTFAWTLHLSYMGKSLSGFQRPREFLRCRAGRHARTVADISANHADQSPTPKSVEGCHCTTESQIAVLAVTESVDLTYPRPATSNVTQQLLESCRELHTSSMISRTIESGSASWSLVNTTTAKPLSRNTAVSAVKPPIWPLCQMIDL